MSIREKKNKDGSISFYITVFEGYKIDRRGQYVQNRKYKSFKPPKDMPLRQARQIAQQMEFDFTDQYKKKQGSGVNMKLTEVWEWLRNITLQISKRIYTRNDCEISSKQRFYLK